MSKATNQVGQKVKRGAIKAFREFLNNKYDEFDFRGGVSVGKYRAGDHNQYGNRTRKYGDWLYFQDRDMFNELFGRTLRGNGESDFESAKWIQENNQ